MKYAVVTGSTKGIGHAIALDLLRRGCYVIMNYSASDDVAEKVRGELSSVSHNFTIIKANLSCFDGLEIFVDKILEVSRSIDYLVLNVGITKRVDFDGIDREDWNLILNANLTIPFFLIKKIGHSINNNGRIIFIGSILGTIPHAISTPYSVSKAGLNMLAKCLVKDFSSRSITVNVVAPGFVNTSWQEGKDVQHLNRITEKISLKRLASADEISSTCMHLIDNGYINGQIITVDGGYDYM